MTKYGFYSIVQKLPNVYHVRSRERRDLQNLIDEVPLPGSSISESKSTDYLARIIVDRDVVMKILQFLGSTLDYDNFKQQIAETPDQAHKPYHSVWKVIADSLGAYGKPELSNKHK
jgi:hypothetical protein